jgi:hypothetical protein
MITVLLRCRVADYAVWKPQYDRAVDRMTEIGSSQVWRGCDDPNLVVIVETFESREIAEAAFNNPVVLEEMPKHGVDMSSVQVDFLEDAGLHMRGAA